MVAGSGPAKGRCVSNDINVQNFWNKHTNFEKPWSCQE